MNAKQSYKQRGKGVELSLFSLGSDRTEDGGGKSHTNSRMKIGGDRYTSARNSPSTSAPNVDIQRLIWAPRCRLLPEKMSGRQA